MQAVVGKYYLTLGFWAQPLQISLNQTNTSSSMGLTGSSGCPENSHGAISAFHIGECCRYQLLLLYLYAVCPGCIRALQASSFEPHHEVLLLSSYRTSKLWDTSNTLWLWSALARYHHSLHSWIGELVLWIFQEHCVWT